jgi:hypothetical protein
MKCFLFIVLFPFFVSGNSLHPADSMVKTKKQRFAGIYLNGGIFVTPSVYMNRGELSRLSPEFLLQPYSSYKESSYAKSGYTGNSNFELGFSFYNNFGKIDSLRKRWQTHIGLTYLSDQSAIASFENYTSERKDTLVSVSGGPSYYKDQVYYNLVYTTYSSKYLGLDISETFTGDSKKMLSMTGGLGLSGMAAIDPHLHENSGVWSGEYITADPHFNYDSAHVSISGYKFTSTDRIITTEKRASLYTVYATAGFNIRWLNTKKKLCLVLNPMVKAGIRMFNLAGAGQYNHAYILPCINLKLMFD